MNNILDYFQWNSTYRMGEFNASSEFFISCQESCCAQTFKKLFLKKKWTIQRSVEVLTTTCIATNFGSNIRPENSQQQAETHPVGVQKDFRGLKYEYVSMRRVWVSKNVICQRKV